MNIAEQLKAFHGDNLNEMMGEADRIGEVRQCWETETTEYTFADGSVMVVWNTDVTTYGSAQ